jgi:hypothetical protein
MSRYSAGIIDALTNPLHRARWAKLMARNRYAALQELNIETVRRGIVVSQHFINGEWVSSSRAPMTLPRVRFIEGDGE